MLVGAVALIWEPQFLGDGYVSVRNAYLGDVHLELKGTDEVKGVADDKPAKELA